MNFLNLFMLLTPIILLFFVCYGGVKGWWVWGWVHREGQIDMVDEFHMSHYIPRLEPKTKTVEKVCSFCGSHLLPDHIACPNCGGPNHWYIGSVLPPTTPLPPIIPPLPFPRQSLIRDLVPALPFDLIVWEAAAAVQDGSNFLQFSGSSTGYSDARFMVKTTDHLCTLTCTRGQLRYTSRSGKTVVVKVGDQIVLERHLLPANAA